MRRSYHLDGPAAAGFKPPSSSRCPRARLDRGASPGRSSPASMRRPLALALAAVALVSGGCSTSPCQRLGEKLCACTGLAGDVCTTQVEDQLKAVHSSLDTQDEC